MAIQYTINSDTGTLPATVACSTNWFAIALHSVRLRGIANDMLFKCIGRVLRLLFRQTKPFDGAFAFVAFAVALSVAWQSDRF